MPPAGESYCGVASAVITPSRNLPLAGYSTLGLTADGSWRDLVARVFYLAGTNGEAVVLCVVDLHSGTGGLRERILGRLDPRLGIEPDRFLLAGTHTHTGPGGLYGNSLFDAFCQSKPGRDDDLLDELAGTIAAAVARAVDGARPARLGVAETSVYRVAHNRSLPAFTANENSARWRSAGYPAAGAPDYLPARAWAVDPRLTALALVDVATGKTMAGLIRFGCHATTLGPRLPIYSPDWPGVTAEAVAGFLRADYRDPRPTVAVLQGACGDTNGADWDPSAPGLGDSTGAFGMLLTQRVADKVGGPATRCLREAALAADRFEVVSVAHTWLPVDLMVDGDPATELSNRWVYGLPTIGGSEESRTGLAGEGMTSSVYPESDPQHPKAPALDIPGINAGAWRLLGPAPRLPLNLVRLGPLTLATIPGEITVMAAHRLESAVSDALGAGAKVRVLSYTGEYNGYHVTREEYDMQHYEGSSCLYGRNVLDHLVALYVRRLAPRLT